MISKKQSKKTITLILSKEDTLDLPALEKNYNKVEWKLISPKEFQQLLNKSKEIKTDLFLLDLDLPDTDSLELCKQIKKSSQFRFIPVLLLTTHDDDIISGLEAGAVDFINKPCDHRELFSRINVQLKRSPDHAESPSEKLQPKALQRNKDLYHSLFEQSNDAIFILDIGRGGFVDANRAAESLTGRPVEEIKKLSIEDLSPSGLQEQIEKAQKKKTVSQIKEVQYHRPDGEIRTANLTLVPIDESLTFAIVHDITEMKKILSEANENHAWNISILENTADSLWALDKNFNMIYANKQFLDVNVVLFGKAPKKGDNLVSGMPEWKRNTWIDRYSRAFSGEVLSFEESFASPFQPNQMFYMQYRINPLYLGEKIVGATVYGTDMTEQRQHEEIIQRIDKLQSIGTLAGGIAHDFNNLLTALYGNLSLAKLSVKENDESYKYLQAAEESMERATSLTRQLLTFSKGGAPRREKLDLLSLIEEILRLDLAGSNVKHIINAPENLWTILGDRGQIQQVISNLVINAVHAMPEGGKLEIQLENQPLFEDNAELTPGGYVKIMIKDQGYGIPKNNLLRIFDPYFTTKESGTGLGLAEAFSIVNRHHGRISVDSEEGKGSCFSIWLPTPAEETPDWENTEDAQNTNSNKKNSIHRVLVMDDERLVLKTAKAILEKLDYQVEVVEDGSEAVGAYKRAMDENNPFDMVILDLTIPGGMGGVETHKGIKALDPNAHCFVSSGYYDDHVMSDFQRYGFAGKINKPYSFDKLRILLRNNVRQD